MDEELLDQLLANSPECWNYPGTNKEDMVLQYVRRLEEQVTTNHASWCDGDCDD